MFKMSDLLPVLLSMTPLQPQLIASSEEMTPMSIVLCFHNLSQFNVVMDNTMMID